VLVGREGERDRLEARLGRATEGQGGTVVVGGEAGIGKSRLLVELAGEAMELIASDLAERERAVTAVRR